MTTVPKLSALNLLERIIEYVHMTDDESEWTFEEQKGNPPKFVRLQQIQSLMQAFVPELMASESMRKSIGNFFAGSFIVLRAMDVYSNMVGLMNHTIEGSRFSDTKSNKLDVFDLQNNYCNLMDYYLKLMNLLNHNHNEMKGSDPGMFSYIVTNAISESIRAEAGCVSHLLSEFIDPGNHAYTEDELVDQFHYPCMDLLDVDMHWM